VVRLRIVQDHIHVRKRGEAPVRLVARWGRRGHRTSGRYNHRRVSTRRIRRGTATAVDRAPQLKRGRRTQAAHIGWD